MIIRERERESNNSTVYISHSYYGLNQEFLILELILLF